MISASEVLEAARKSLMAYSVLTNAQYETPAHLIQIADILEAVERGEKKRVVITIAPRHGKSMVCSQYFPAWYLGRNPDKYIICCTYGQNLADDFGRRVREQLLDPLYKTIFPTAEIKKETTAAARMETTEGGVYYSVGVGGPITGRGAHLLLIDDPIANREEADSPTRLEHLHDWYRSVAYTRLMPNASIIVIMTRWAQEDLVGRLLKDHAHENWEVINMPAISDEGKALWPEAYPLEALEIIRQSLGPYDWSCLYQQNPISKAGVLFKREWMKSGSEPKYSSIYIGFDPAISKSELADESSATVVGIGYGKPPKLVEIETRHGHFNFQEQINLLRALNAQYKPSMIGIEDVAYQRALAEVLQREGLPVRLVKADTDKVRRAMQVTGLFEQGRICVNTPELIQQLLSFRGATEPNDMCFVSGTIVATPHGGRFIETLKVGDKVLSPYGIDTVLETGNRAANVITKYGLTGTADHKVFTWQRGFVSISSAEGLSFLTFREVFIWRYLNLLNLMEKDFNYWGREGITSQSYQHQKLKVASVLKDFMSRSGNLIMEKRFLKNMLFITRMAILLITISITWSVYLLGNIVQNITRELVTNKLKNILNKSGHLLQLGMVLKKVWLGIETIGKKVLEKVLYHIQENVIFAARIIQPRQSALDFVESVAYKNIIEKSPNLKLDCVRHVATNLKQKESLEEPNAQENVTVYNIKTSSGMYYANNILVSNCDSFVHACRLIIRYCPNVVNDPDDVKPFQSLPNEVYQQRRVDKFLERRRKQCADRAKGEGRDFTLGSKW